MKNVYMIKRIAVDAGCGSTYMSFHNSYEDAKNTAFMYANEYRSLIQETWPQMRNEKAWLISEDHDIVSVSFNDPESHKCPIHLEFVVVEFPIDSKLETDFVLGVGSELGAFSLKRSREYREQALERSAQEIAKQRDN